MSFQIFVFCVLWNTRTITLVNHFALNTIDITILKKVPIIIAIAEFTIAVFGRDTIAKNGCIKATNEIKIKLKTQAIMLNVDFEIFLEVRWLNRKMLQYPGTKYCNKSGIFSKINVNSLIFSPTFSVYYLCYFSQSFD